MIIFHIASRALRVKVNRYSIRVSCVSFRREDKLEQVEEIQDTGYRMGASYDSKGRLSSISQESRQAKYEIEDDENDHDEDDESTEEEEIDEELEGNPQEPGQKKSALSNVVRWLSDSIGVTDAKYQKKLRVNLKKATMFRKVSDPYIERIAKRMDRILFKKVRSIHWLFCLVLSYAVVGRRPYDSRRAAGM